MPMQLIEITSIRRNPSAKGVPIKVQMPEAITSDTECSRACRALGCDLRALRVGLSAPESVGCVRVFSAGKEIATIWA